MEVVDYFSGTIRAFTTSYIITDEDTDISLVSKIAVIVAKYGLNCSFGVDSFPKRYFYISGDDLKTLEQASNEVKAL